MSAAAGLFRAPAHSVVASPDRGVPTRPVTLPQVIRSEWIKFRTLRSTLAVLGVALVGLVVIALVVAHNTRHITPNLAANDIVASSPLQGYFLGQLLMGALGVLFVTGEYSTGMIRATLVAVPKRLPVLWAKLVVFATVAVATLVPTCIVAFIAAQALLSHYRTGFSLGDPHVVRVVVGTGVYLTLVGVIGSALGWIVRSTPGALVAYVTLMLILPVLLGNAFGTTGKQVGEYLPTNAGSAFISNLPEQPALSPWTGGFIVLAWTVAALGVAAVVLRRKDA